MDGDIAAPEIRRLSSLNDQIVLPATEGAATELFKVDEFIRYEGHLVLLGWSKNPSTQIHSCEVTEQTFFRYPRSDVNTALALPHHSKTGFCLVLSDPQNEDLHLLINGIQILIPMAEVTPAEAAPQIHEMQADLFECLKKISFASPLWWICRDMMQKVNPKASLATGALDHVLGSVAGSVFAGWLIHDQRTMVWLENKDGQPISLKNAYWHDRPDVRNHQAGESLTDPKVGFVCETQHVGSEFCLRAASAQGIFEIATTRRKTMRGSTAKAAEQLFKITTPRLDYSNRFEKVDLPYLNRFERRTSQDQSTPPTMVRTQGESLRDPEISVIIPLYGRIDFVEHHLLAFCQDTDFAKKTEIIYVVDDPNLDLQLKGLEPILHRLTQCSFRTLSNGRNNGFAKACNLGASDAKADTLIFMNSDIFPRRNGWTGRLADILRTHEDIGIVSPRLLFPDGGLQHAGMVPIWRDALQIWSNHHPQMGFDPALDPHQELSRVPLVSGACVAMRARDFHAVNGWSEDYLIGDYEDSDLCLKLRELGLASAYAPEIELIHLERQSLQLSGEANFREYVTLLNGFRYTRRWHSILKAIAT